MAKPRYIPVQRAQSAICRPPIVKERSVMRWQKA